MSGFKKPDFADRQNTAAKAKKGVLLIQRSKNGSELE
jgi:hypothetical protein